VPESHGQDPRPDEGIFPTFFMAGFECSTFVWKDGQRKDYVALTGHDRHLEEDYRRLMDLGIGVAREAIRWPLVDRGRSRYDWSTLERRPCDPYIEELRRWQKLLDSPKQIEAEAMDGGALPRPSVAVCPARGSGRVQLSEVRSRARELAERDPAIHPVKNTVKMAP